MTCAIYGPIRFILRHFAEPIGLVHYVTSAVFHRGFKHEKSDESTRPFYFFRVFETPMKHEAGVFEITSPTKEN